jgi:nucleoside-diphosphate-sugar epimerase
MDSHVLDAVAAGVTRRVIYVADPTCYGPTGTRAITEDELPALPVRAGGVTPALDRLDGYLIAGLPIVTALPGCVYGHASWFRECVADLIMAGRRVPQFGKTGPWVSPIHVHDCARALVHLAERGEVGSRYFLANNDAVRLHEFAQAFARIANRPLRVWRAPAVAAELFASRPLAGYYVQGNAVFSNIRLRGSGFRFRYSTLDQGLEDILGALYE